MRVPHRLHLGGQAPIRPHLTIHAIPAPIHHPQGQTQHRGRAHPEKHGARTDPHALDVPWALLLRKYEATDNRPGMAHHPRQRQREAPLRKPALVIRQPHAIDRDPRKDPRANQKNREVPRRDRFRRRQHDEPGAADQETPGEEPRAVPGPVRQEARADADEEGDEVRRRGQPLRVDRRVAHVADHGGEVGGEGPEGDVAAEEEDGPAVAFRVAQGGEGGVRVDLAFGRGAAEFDGARGDDVVLAGREEAALGGGVGQVEVGEEGDDDGGEALLGMQLPAFEGCAGLDDAVGERCRERVGQRGGGQVQTVSEPYLALVVEERQVERDCW